jgi:hypothetical protein
MADNHILETPDGRNIIVRGGLCRKGNPEIEPNERARLAGDLMDARRAVRYVKGNLEKIPAARVAVDAAKRAVGERGTVRWNDGTPDLTRHLAKNGPYAAQFLDTTRRKQTSIEARTPKESSGDRPLVKELPCRKDRMLAGTTSLRQASSASRLLACGGDHGIRLEWQPHAADRNREAPDARGTGCATRGISVGTYSRRWMTRSRGALHRRPPWSIDDETLNHQG